MVLHLLAHGQPKPSEPCMHDTILPGTRVDTAEVSLYARWLYPSYYDFARERSGIHEAHAYSIMDAREIKGERLLRLR